MSVMNYCLFKTTLQQLQECYERLDREDLSQSEHEARQAMVDLCRQIVKEVDSGQVDIEQEQRSSYETR